MSWSTNASRSDGDGESKTTGRPDQPNRPGPRVPHVGSEPAVALIVSAPEMAEFFEQMGIPLDSMDAPRRPPNPNEIDRMAQLSGECGYWNASPAENAAVGIELPPPPGA